MLLGAPFTEKLELSKDDVLRRSDDQGFAVNIEFPGPGESPRVKRIAAGEVDVRLEAGRAS